MFGYLSGVAAPTTGEANLVEKTTDDDLVAWMSNYCRQHPSDTIEKAAGALVHGLLGR